MFTARYALSPYIKQIHFVFKGLMTLILRTHGSMTLLWQAFNGAVID
jgi:hypothetical protein